MEMEVECNAIGPASNPAGKRFVSIQFGVEQDVTRAQATTGVPALWDNRVVIFLPEEIWKKTGDRFSVGDKFMMNFGGSKIELKRLKKG
jgi:hypothetical protein